MIKNECDKYNIPNIYKLNYDVVYASEIGFRFFGSIIFFIHSLIHNESVKNLKL